MDIRVYRISTCHWCDKVEAFLKKHGIHYKSIVIDLLGGNEQEKAIAESYHLSKQRSFPVTYIDGSCVIGFHESRLTHLLKLPSCREERKEIGRGDAEGNACPSSEDKYRRETVEKVREWLIQEAESHGYKINPDQKMVDDILWGLFVNEKRYGYKACPCRLATGKYQMDCDIICPCSYCFIDVEKNGRCYCSLFVSDRFISGDPSLPQYVPDSRERSEGREKTIEVVKEKAVEVIETPVIPYKNYIRVVGFIQDNADRNRANEGFLKMVSALDLDASAVKWHENTAYVTTIINGAKIDARLRQDADVYIYQIACMATDGSAIHDKKFFQQADLTEHKNKLFECDIIVPKKEAVQSIIPTQRYMSYVYNNYRIEAGFEGEGVGKDTFIIIPDGYMFGKIVEDLVALEANYHLLSMERQRYILAEDKLNLLDSKIVSKMGTISMNLAKSLPEELKGWLHGLSDNFSEISGITEEFRHHMNYTILKKDAVKKIFNDWGENNGNINLPYPLLSKYFLESADNLSDQYQRLFMRINGIRREMMDLITMLRTKIDLVLQEQSLELQRSVDETTKTQMMMQHTVEGLSVIILSYYIIHLAGFIFESLEASQMINVSLATVKAIFVPIAITLSWFLTFRARRLIKGHKSNKSK